MKRIVLCIAVFISALCVNAQSKLQEADFVGNVRVLNADSTTLNLDKLATQVKSKATGSKIWLGVGSTKSFIEVPGKASSIVFEKDTPMKLVVRGSDNNLDPTSVVSIFQYIIKGGDRRAVFGKINNLFGNSESGLKKISFEGKKFGKNSYIIEFTVSEPGEYGIMVNNPTLENESSNIVVYSFSVR